MTRPRTHPHPRHGFTFIEVLFAIIILGIGSIMIAGMLPVAIKQSSDTRNAITGKAACEAGFAYVQAIAATSNFAALPPTANDQTPPPTTALVLPGIGSPSPGQMIPLTSTFLANNPVTFAAFGSITGSRVVASDPRTQWLAFYGRAPFAPAAKLVVLALRLQNIERVPAYVTAPPTTPSPINTLTINDNDPHLLTAAIVDGGALNPDTITLTGTTQSLAAADAGAFAIVASSPAATATPADPDATNRPFRNNGRVFRLGKLVSGTPIAPPLVYELQPGYDLPPRVPEVRNAAGTVVQAEMPDASMDASTTTQVWLVGKGLLNPALAYDPANNPYVGQVQDVSVLTTQVQLTNP